MAIRHAARGPRRRIRLRTAAALGGLALAAASGSAVTGIGPASAALAQLRTTQPRVARPAAALPPTISADPLPTPQVDGIVFSTTIVGNTVYAVGRFSTARPAGVALGGAGQVARTNVLAFDLTTGALLPFAPVVTAVPFRSAVDPGPYCLSEGAQTWLCDAVLRVAAAPDGSRVYIGGDFTSVDGRPRYRVAAFDTATGTLDPSFAPAVSSRVRAIAVGTHGVYLGGSFTSVDGVAHYRLAQLDPTGRLVAGFTAIANGDVWSDTLTTGQDRLVVGGQFTTLSGVIKVGLGAVSASTGGAAPWLGQPVQFHPATHSIGWITDLTTVGGTVYASGADHAGYPAFEGRLAADAQTGRLLWVDQCHGDTQALAVSGGVVYSVSHDHDCSMMNAWPQTTPFTYQRFVAETAAATTVNGMGQAVPSLLDVFPGFDYGPPTSYWKNGTWAVAAAGDYVVVGGEFLTVNGAPQQGLARFVLRALSPQRVAPEFFAAATAVCVIPGTATVTWRTTWDRDDAALTYRVYRDNVQVATVGPTPSTFWSRPTLSWIDRSAGDGLPHTYRVAAVDPDGNLTGSLAAAPITVPPGSGTDPGYAAAVLRDGAIHYWPLAEAPGNATARDMIGGSGLALGAGVALGGAGIAGGAGATSAAFNGTATGTSGTTTPEPGPQTFSLEAWFRTTSRSGGKIIGLGNSIAGVSSWYDRQIWLGQDGKVNAGVHPGPLDLVTGPLVYNDGRWHDVVMTDGPYGLVLYVDGAQVAAQGDAIGAQPFSGFWRVGGDNLTGWANPWPSITGGWPISRDLAASIAQVAVYPGVLTADQVLDHFVRGIS